MDAASFEEHPLWTTNDNLRDALASAEARGETAAAHHLDRVRYLVSAVDGHREPTDSAPYSNASLTGLQGGVQQVLTEVQNYAANGNLGHLSNADTYGDSVLQVLGTLPTSILKGGGASAANKLFVEYRDAAQQALDSALEANESLKKQLSEQTSEAETQIAQLTAEIAALSAKISQDETRLDTALTNTNETFNTKQAERQEAFTTWLEEQSARLKDLAAKDLRSAKESGQQAKEALDEIQALRDETKVVAGLAVGDQVARGYKGYSLRQWVAGIVAYGAGFIALALGALAVVRTFRGIDPGDNISWQYAVLKLGLTVSAVVAAVVAFRLGSHLLAQAATAKRFELELKAIGPLFARDEEQETLMKVKQDLVTRSFGRGWGSSNQSKEILEPKLLEQVAEAVGRILQRNSAP